MIINIIKCSYKIINTELFSDFVSIFIVKTECDLELSVFIKCALMCLLLYPFYNNSRDY